MLYVLFTVFSTYNVSSTCLYARFVAPVSTRVVPVLPLHSSTFSALWFQAQYVGAARVVITVVGFLSVNICRQCMQESWLYVFDGRFSARLSSI